MRQITIEPGQRVRVFRRRFSSLPQTIEFSASAVAPGRPASGRVERIGSRWILGRTRSAQQLESHNRVRKGFWDTIFEIFVVPDVAVVVTIGRPRLARRLLIFALALAVIAAAAVLALTLGR